MAATLARSPLHTKILNLSGIPHEVLLFSSSLLFITTAETASYVGHNDIPVHLLFSDHRFEKKTPLNPPEGITLFCQSLISSYSQMWGWRGSGDDSFQTHMRPGGNNISVMYSLNVK